jgi:hypothetical protein
VVLASFQLQLRGIESWFFLPDSTPIEIITKSLFGSTEGRGEILMEERGREERGEEERYFN